MVDFSHLQQLEVPSSKTAEYKIHQITVNGKSPVLVVAPATDANKPYFNALLKRAGKTARQVKAGKVDAEMIEKNREEDRELYPKYVVRGWYDMVDANGDEVEFSVSNCGDFVNALPGYIFDDCRTFCGEMQNYAEVMDIEITAKN